MAKFIKNPVFRRNFEERTIAPALAKTVSELSAIFRNVIDSAIFFWPNETRRRNQKVVGSPRDIVDTGRFRDSQAINKISLKRFEIYWAASYSVLILLGGVSRADGTETPGRDWISEGIDSTDIAAIFAKNMNKN
jgi:hypothetical protein